MDSSPSSLPPVSMERLLRFGDWLTTVRGISETSAQMYIYMTSQVCGRGGHTKTSQEKSAWRAWHEFNGKPLPRRKRGPKPRSWPALTQFRAYLDAHCSAATAESYHKQMQWVVITLGDEATQTVPALPAMCRGVEAHGGLLTQTQGTWRGKPLASAWNRFKRFMVASGVEVPMRSLDVPRGVLRTIWRLRSAEMSWRRLGALQWCHVTRTGEVWDLRDRQGSVYFGTTIPRNDLETLHAWSGQGVELPREVAGGYVAHLGTYEKTSPHVFHWPVDNRLFSMSDFKAAFAEGESVWGGDQ